MPWEMPWDEPDPTGPVDVSLDKRGTAGARSAADLVGPPDPEPEPLAEWEPTPGREWGRSELVVPAEVSLRIPVWWPDGGRGNAAAPGSVAPEEPEAADGFESPEPVQPFTWAFDDPEPAPRSSGARRALWILGGATALAVVVAVALVLGGGETSKKGSATGSSAPPPAPSASPPGPASAYVPRALALGGIDGRVQVTWQPPERVGEVVGFMVVAQSREGAVLEHRLVPAGETSAVFASPPMTRDGCVVVATLVRGGTGVTPIRADPVCR